ncbi:hypothetical protein HDU96_000418 [Phlyctochytrium bullatum]|nr:hypothetical protein HDU96_000418 [Phlyctochytrium bullatum]
MQAARIGGLGLLPRVKARLSAAERGAIRSGSVFVFDQEESNIKRWTDGMSWSPSRIHNGCFLIYRTTTLIPHIPHLRQIVKPEDNTDPIPEPEDAPRGPFIPGGLGSLETDLNEPGFNAQLRDGMVVKRDGMVKKTISLEYEGRHVHVVSYYHRGDVRAGRLPIPGRTDVLGTVAIPEELKETLMKSSLTRAGPNINGPSIKESTANLPQNLPHLIAPTRHQSDPAAHLSSGSSTLRVRSRSRGASPMRGTKSLSAQPSRSNSTGGSSSGMYLMPPSPVSLTPPTLDQLLTASNPVGPAATLPRARSRSPSAALFSVDDSVRVSPYRARRDSTSSSGSSAYGSLRRRASSSSRSAATSPMPPPVDPMGTLRLMSSTGSLHSLDGWDYPHPTPPVSSLPSPTGSGHDDSQVSALASAFRFEITAPDDEPHAQRASPQFAGYPYVTSPASIAGTFSPSFAPAMSAPAPPSPLLLGSPATAMLLHQQLLAHDTAPAAEPFRRQSSIASLTGGVAPSLLGADCLSPLSRPSSPADALAGLGRGMPQQQQPPAQSFLAPQQRADTIEDEFLQMLSQPVMDMQAFCPPQPQQQHPQQAFFQQAMGFAPPQQQQQQPYPQVKQEMPFFGMGESEAFGWAAAAAMEESGMMRRVAGM